MSGQHTTNDQIQAMRDLAARLTAEYPALIKAGHIDDWGRFGNFVMQVYPRTLDRSTTARLKAIVRKLLPKGVVLRDCFGPDPIKRKDWDGRTKVVGYTRNYWAFDLDYMVYDKEGNRFS